MLGVESGIKGAMSEGNRNLFEDIESRLDSVAKRYGWDKVIEQLEKNRTNKDLDSVTLVLNSTLKNKGIMLKSSIAMRNSILSSEDFLSSFSLMI